MKIDNKEIRLECPGISVVIPVYDNEENLDELYNRLKKVMDSLTDSYEIIFVDDGSKDNSWTIIEDLHNRDDKIRGIKFSRNFGQHPAIMAGLKHSRGNAAILMDADLQNPPEEIPKLIVKAQDGFDIVYGVREKRKDSLIRIMGSKIYHWLLKKLLGVSLPDLGSPLRYVSRKVIDELIQIPEQTRHTFVLMAWLGFKPAYVIAKHDASKPRKKSRYSYWKLIKMTFELMIGFSPNILRFITGVGFFISLGSLAVGTYYLAVKFICNRILPGFAAIIVSITFLFGITFIFMGIISEYIAELFQASRGRPYYVIDKKLDP